MGAGSVWEGTFVPEPSEGGEEAASRLAQGCSGGP